jgi:beta-galactosidase
MWRTSRTRLGTALFLAVCWSADCQVQAQSSLHASDESAPRQVANFNSDWKFALGEQDGAEQPAFDDSNWQPIRLPHDWAIAGPFDPQSSGYAGKLPWQGVGWYRKKFTLQAADKGSQVYLDFDGVMAFPQVYVNGHLAGGWDYGYMSFRVDVTPYVKFGEPNTVAVRVDTRRHGTRWYPGAGIYRKVTLVISNPVHISHWGTYVTTPQVSDKEAIVDVRTTIENHGDQEATVGVVFTLRDPAGKFLDNGASSITIPAGGSKDFEANMSLHGPQRWDIDHPVLYAVETAVVPLGQLFGSETSDANAIDRETTKFGIRTFEFTADDGFHLNGRRVQLHGVCLHHDQGPLGAAFYTRAMERQLEIMRDMGVNAIRTSHNPPAPELLDLCDRMGFVVWDECFDKWDDKADRVDGQPPLKEYGEKQIRNFVRRDRNHPSVVVWSIGNELNEGPEGISPERVKFMSDFVRKYDSTRPVGMACHIPEQAYTPMFDALDLTGWNYQRRYALYHERNPNKPIIYSESASAFSTRGFYEFPLPTGKTDYSDKFQVSSYDMNAARWSDIADKEFDLMERDRFVAGEFVWTGFDYLGEPTPFDEQARSSYFGIVDLVGIPKDRYWLYRSHWRPDVTTVHILPHWNWPDRIGQNVPVFVYTNGDSAELFLNGKSLGRRSKDIHYRPPVNVAVGKPVKASSESPGGGHPDASGNDGNEGTFWLPASNEPGQWWQVDLGSVQPIGDVVVSFDGNVRFYQYALKISSDGVNWETVVDLHRWREEWGNAVYHHVGADARFVRFEFTKLRNEARVSIRELQVFPQSYFAVVDKYRLRWMDVAYEPGELKAVAYKDGKEIGQAVMRTAGPPAALRLSPDRSDLTASGEDLCYVLVEALDADGNPCPLADDLVRFHVDGPAEIAGVGNGNPLSFEPFQADHRKLFFGKAMLILRTKAGRGGAIHITAQSDSLPPATVTVQSQPRTSSRNGVSTSSQN